MAERRKVAVCAKKEVLKKKRPASHGLGGRGGSGRAEPYFNGGLLVATRA